MVIPPSKRLSKAAGHPLAHARIERGWSQMDLAKRLALQWGAKPRKEKVSRWESGQVEPDLETQYSIAAVLGVPATAVRTHLWPDWIPVGERLLVEGAWTQESCFVLFDSTAGDVLLDRRGFVTLATGSAATLAREWQSPAGARDLFDCTAGDLIDSVAARLPLLRDLEDIHGGGRVRVPVATELRFATELLRGADLGSAEARRLFRLCADLCRIAGWASTDTGFLAAAERYFVLGMRAARAGGDRLSGANLLKCMSLLLSENGRPADALALARSAVEGTADGPARVRAMLTVRQARLHAVLGERRRCEELIRRAEGLMERPDDQLCPPWADYFDEAEHAAQVAACYLALGDHQTSDRWLETTTRLQPASRERDGITYRLWRAENATQLGDIELACHHLGKVAPLTHRGSSQRNRARFSAVRRLLHRHRALPPVRTLDEQVAALLA